MRRSGNGVIVTSGSAGSHGQQPAGELLESYLDEVLVCLRGRPRDVRWLLAEVESHLREAIAAGVAAGLSELAATEEALRRFGPPATVARGQRPWAAYRLVAGQLAEAALLVASLLFAALGAAAIPAGILAVSGNATLVTGDQPGLTATASRCQYLLHQVRAASCQQALTVHHLTEVLRNHLAAGWAGVVLLGVWWAVHLHRKSRVSILPAGFALTVASTLLATVAAFLLAFGILAVLHGNTAAGGLIGSGDLVTTGATLMTAALLGWVAVAWQAARPARKLAAGPPR